MDKGGEIDERFLTFVNVTCDRSAESLSKILQYIVTSFGESVKEKVIMHPYDGASVIAGHISCVQATVCEHFPLCCS